MKKNNSSIANKKEISKIIRPERNKSVRTTFRLTKDGNEILNRLTKDHGIKPKSLIASTVLIDTRDSKTEETSWLSISQIMKSAKDLNFSSLDRSVRKTLVTDKESLNRINKISKTFNIPRDLLVETWLRNLESWFKGVGEEEKKQHKKALEIINKFRSKAGEIYYELKEFLWEDDPVLIRFNILTGLIGDLCSAIENELKKGSPVDPDDFTQRV